MALKARDNLRKLRQRAGYGTAQSFAEAIGVSVQSYARYEKMERDGDIPGIEVSRAVLIAEMLDASVGQVLGIEPIPEQGGTIEGLRRVIIQHPDPSGLRQDAHEVVIEWADASGRPIAVHSYVKADAL